MSAGLLFSRDFSSRGRIGVFLKGGLTKPDPAGSNLQIQGTSSDPFSSHGWRVICLSLLLELPHTDFLALFLGLTAVTFSVLCLQVRRESQGNKSPLGLMLVWVGAKLLCFHLPAVGRVLMAQPRRASPAWPGLGITTSALHSCRNPSPRGICPTDQPVPAGMMPGAMPRPAWGGY